MGRTSRGGVGDLRTLPLNWRGCITSFSLAVASVVQEMRHSDAWLLQMYRQTRRWEAYKRLGLYIDRLSSSGFSLLSLAYSSGSGWHCAELSVGLSLWVHALPGVKGQLASRIPPPP